VRERPRLLAIFSDSPASAQPLRKVIDEHFDATLMREIAVEHRRGRRVFVGTTHVYAGRPVAWNIGAIAASGQPTALDLMQRILLASAAVPIMLAPVYIEVEAGGKRYHEMHGDGGIRGRCSLQRLVSISRGDGRLGLASGAAGVCGKSRRAGGRTALSGRTNAARLRQASSTQPSTVSAPSSHRTTSAAMGWSTAA
jgi:predicted acylesterase/phospholipase RssA